MAHNEFSPSGRIAVGAACAACCAVPVAVIAGVVSVAALAALSATAGSVALVVGSVFLLWRGRLPRVRLAGRVAVAGTGVAAATLGLAADGRSSTALVSIGVAMLATVAVLALDETRRRAR